MIIILIMMIIAGTLKLMYRISSRSHHSEILFQHPVWWGNNLWTARYWGQYLQRLTCTRVHSFNIKPTYMHLRIRISLSTLYHAARFQGRYLLGWNMRWYFEGSRISRCGKISRKYSICNTFAIILCKPFFYLCLGKPHPPILCSHCTSVVSYSRGGLKWKRRC